MSYTEHLFFSLKLSACMVVGSVAAIIHGLYPDVLTTSTTFVVGYLHNQMSKRREMNELNKAIRRDMHKLKRQ